MKIFVTGSSGFIGSHLSPLLEKTSDVYHLKSDLLDFDSVRKELNDFAPDIIVHLAARTEVEKSFYEPNSFSQVNYVGTVNLIDGACKLTKKPYFIFASTMEVYGWQPISDEIKDGKIPTILPVFDENTAPNPNAPYAVAKYACEKYLEYAGRAMDLPYTIIRQTNAYGRQDNNFFVTEQFVWQMVNNADEVNFGYKDAYRNFIFIDDLLDAWAAVITNPDKCVNQIFTMGPSNAVQIEQHAANIATLLGWTGKINWNKKPLRNGEIYLLNSGHEKITSRTGWVPKVSYIDGLIKTIEIWKNK